jgi:hypothetical protein
MQTRNDIRRVVILVDRGGSRRWVHALADRLTTSLGREVAIRARPALHRREALPFEELDRALQGSSPLDLGGWIGTDDVPLLAETLGDGDLVVDTGSDGNIWDPQGPATILTTKIEGHGGSAGLVAALAGGATVRLGIVATQLGQSHELVSTAICIPVRDPISCFLDTLFARLITLIDAAVRHLQTGRPLPLTSPPEKRVSAQVEPRYGLTRKVEAAARRLAHRMVGPLVRTADWTIGIRRIESAAAGMPDQPPPDLLRLFSGDHGRFFADPMLLTHDGATWLFFEEMDHARGVGHLACVSLRHDGSMSERMPVIRRFTHLSYPFVFAHEGEVYMIPETSADRRVELWRARHLPDQWEQVAILLDGVDAVDATVEYDSNHRRWWMFVSVAEPGGSTFDTLSIYHSDRLAGGWTAHRLNPVKLDSASSRPGGRILEVDGQWLRPAQDCSNGYGGALNWCRITALTPDDFHEEVIGRWAPPPGYRGLHTYTRSGDWEAIDLQRRRWRWQ